MIDRVRAAGRVKRSFRVHPVVALLGPRQCGKTTLARHLAGREKSTYFDLENPEDRARMEHPLRALQGLSGLVVIDEFQRAPSVSEILRVLVDRRPRRTRFLVLGSASPDLVKGVSESLAGRVGFVDLSGFDVEEVGANNQERLWVRGGFPPSFLAPDDDTATAWREGFIRTFLERDIPQLGIAVPSETLRRFWTMVAHYHGQIWNGAEFARSLGSAESTARRYLDILVGSYVVRALPPWFENLAKRQVKSPKVYIRDSGLLHALLGVRSLHEVTGHPKLGASWEGFALEQLLAILGTRDAYFWATHGGAELDLLLMLRGKRYGVEFKYADAPRPTRSMHQAMEDLRLEHLWIVYPGSSRYEVADRMSVAPLPEVARRLSGVSAPARTSRPARRARPRARGSRRSSGGTAR